MSLNPQDHYCWNTQNYIAPKIGAFSDADFLNEILKYEKQFGKQIVLQVFKNALPLRNAPKEIGRIFILYEKLLSISG